MSCAGDRPAAGSRAGRLHDRVHGRAAARRAGRASSSGVRPRSVVPPGWPRARRSVVRVVAVASRRHAAVPAIVSTVIRGASAGPQAVRGAGVGEGLGHQRHEGRAAAHQRHRGLDQRLSSSRITAPARPNSSSSSLLGALGGERSGRVAEHALAHLGGDVRDEAVDRQCPGRPPRCGRWAWPPRIETHGLGARRATCSATSSSCAGLWQSTTTSARSASSALDADGLAAELRGERLGPRA